VRRMLERDAKREGNGGALQTSGIIALIVGFAAGYGVREWVSRRRRQAAERRAG
jgi:hypothetical protein